MMNMAELSPYTDINAFNYCSYFITWTAALYYILFSQLRFQATKTRG